MGRPRSCIATHSSPKFRARARALVFAAMTAAPLMACGRSSLMHPDLIEETNAAQPASVGGSAGASGSHAGSGAGAHSGSAGQASMNGTGTAGGAFAGAAGAALGGSGGEAGDEASFAGTDDSVRTLPHCDRAVTPILDGPLAYESEGDAQASVTGDWNKDGKLDLATSNSDGSVSVLFGRGDGSFTSASLLRSGLESRGTATGTSSIAALDLDGNGSRDLVVGHSAVAAVAVFLSESAGSFAPASIHAVTGNALGLALGDFTGDAIADIAVASASSVNVLPGTGNGAFGSETVTPLQGTLAGIAAADLNHDGRLDVVAVGSTEIRVLLGVGAANFAQGPAYASSDTHNTVTIGDFNADGQLDLALTDTCEPHPNPSSALEIMLGQGDGSFPRRDKYASSMECLPRIAVGDVNGDGALDLLTSADSGLLGNGDGTFQRDTIRTKASGGDLLGLGDWNGDGKLDLASAAGRWLTVHLGNGDGSFGSAELYYAGFEPHSLTLADLDRDGVLDAITPVYYSYHGGPFASSLSVLLGVTNGTFPNDVPYSTEQPANQVALSDLNEDGFQDLVTLSNRTVGVYLATGNGAFAPQQLVWNDSQNRLLNLVAGDLNADQHADLAFTTDVGSLVLLFGRGDGTVSVRPPLRLDARADGLVLLDANRDSLLDIALNFPDLQSVGVLLNNGDGTFALGRKYPTSNAQYAITSADLNADGKADLVTWGGETLSILLGAGNGSFARRVNYQNGAGTLVAVDFDQDGKQDLLTTSGGFSLLLGAGDGTLSCAARYALGLGMAGLAVGDLNRDGRLDVATTMYYGLGAFLNSTP